VLLISNCYPIINFDSGLVANVYPVDVLIDEVMKKASKIAGQSKLITQICKESINKGILFQISLFALPVLGMGPTPRDCSNHSAIETPLSKGC